MRFEDKLIENLDFGRSGLNSSVFWKTFRLILMHFFFILNNVFWRISALKCFVFQKSDFSRLSIDRTCFSINRNCDKNFGLSLPDSIDVRSILDWSQLKNFQFLCFWPNFFFMHHLCLGFTCIVLFLYPSFSFVVISLIIFTHNMHTLCYIGYPTW